MQTFPDDDELKLFKSYLEKYNYVIDDEYDMRLFCNGFFEDYEELFPGKKCESKIALYCCLMKSSGLIKDSNNINKNLQLENIPKIINTLFSWTMQTPPPLDKLSELKAHESSNDEEEKVMKQLIKDLLRILGQESSEKESLLDYLPGFSIGYLGSLILFGPYEIIEIPPYRLSKIKKTHLVVCLYEEEHITTNSFSGNKEKEIKELLTTEQQILCMLPHLPQFMILDCRKCPTFEIEDTKKQKWEKYHHGLIITKRDVGTWKEKFFEQLKQALYDNSAYTVLKHPRESSIFMDALMDDRARYQSSIAYMLFQHDNYYNSHKYYKMAAENKNPDANATLQLSIMYRDGFGCIPSVERAEYWRSKVDTSVKFR